MDIWDINKLILFIAFVIPGFISLKYYELLFPSATRSASDQLVDAIAYSCINYAILFLPIIWFEKQGIFSTCPIGYYIFYLCVFIIAPLLWVTIWKKIRTSEFFQRNAPHPTGKPWDFIFQQRKAYWIKVTLTDGTIIAGRYAEKSFASSAPAEEQIYLEETWILGKEGEFERKINQTAGVLILTKNISHVEFRD
ncbi:MAG TPA: DUF6338 family protein [Xanthomonadaceae bacterium]|jgi:hypothetical protein